MEEQSLVHLLPDDVLVDVLRRLAPRSLAASRCVCKAWHPIIDARCLLRADLLPHSLGGIFIYFYQFGPNSQFFHPSTSGPAISGNLHYSLDHTAVEDHCNGLVLLFTCVVNPATRQWARLPPYPDATMVTENIYLVFDPTISPHYEVIRIPYVAWKYYLGPISEDSEWPPLPYILNVFSSKTGQWEERAFVREGNPMGTVADMLQRSREYKGYGVYWRGALYVHCQYNFFCKISLSDHKYQVIRLPVEIEDSKVEELYFGRSKEGVQCALVDYPYGLRIWILNESCGRIEWVLKHHVDLQPVMARWDYHQQSDEPWIFEETWRYGDSDDEEDYTVVEKINWKSRYITIIGFHPFDDVVFLNDTLHRGLAYHVNSSKVQDLGNQCPGNYFEMNGPIWSAFPYTPCRMGDLSENS